MAPVEGVQLDEESLSQLGFKIDSSRPDSEVYVRPLGVGNTGLVVKVTLRRQCDEVTSAMLSLGWAYKLPIGGVNLHYAIRDNPTFDDVRRLLKELDPEIG